MQQPVPDRVMYHLFLRHVAGMERLAQEAQASGKDPGPWRRHALRKFSLTEEERQKLLPIANQYEAQVRKQQEQSHSITSDFKARYFPAGKWAKGQPLPPLPAELTLLRQQRSVLTDQTMTRVANALGPVRMEAVTQRLRYDMGSVSRVKITNPEIFQQKGAAK